MKRDYWTASFKHTAGRR